MGRFKLVGIAVLAAVVVLLVVITLTPAAESPGAVAVKPPAGNPEEASPSALFVGDSFPAGSGAPSKNEAASCLAAAAMGWVCNVDAQAATGFLADGQHVASKYSRLIDRLPDSRRRYLADIVIIDAGRNDKRAPSAELNAAITEYLDAVRRAWPKAELVVIEPYVMNSQAPVLAPDALNHLRAEAERHGAHVINPHASGWILPGGTSKDLDADGHRYIAQRLVAALRELGLDDLEVTDRRIFTD